MASDMDRFKKVTALIYAEQGKFFLNAFWTEFGSDAENIWKYGKKIIELDHQNGKRGSDLDEFSAHRFLEQMGETKRVIELRESLRSIDLDSNKRMALIEYLLFSYKQTIKELLSRPQGDNEELRQAQENLSAAQDAVDQMNEAMSALKKEEQETKAKISELEKKANNTSLGQVQRNAASNELEQLRKGDNLRLRIGKVKTATAIASDAVAKAQKYFDELKLKGGGVCPGSMWWMQRELTEAKKYLPQSKQK